MSRAAWQALMLTALVAVLAVAVALPDRRGVASERGPLVPGLDARAVTGLELVRVGEPPIVVAIGRGGARVTAPSVGLADPVALRDLLSAIATARVDRWRRGAAAWRAAGLDHPSLAVKVTTGGRDVTIVVGAEVAAAGQRWLGVPPDRAALVPAWVATALDRRVDSLRVRRIIGVAAPTGVELHGLGVDLVLAGTALVRRDAGASVRLAPARRAALLDAIDGLALVGFDGAPVGDPIGTLRVLGGDAPAELSWFGPCAGSAAGAPELVQVDATVGAGCIASRQLDALLAAARAAAAADAVSAQPLDGSAVLDRLVVEGGVELVRHGATWALLDRTTERAADPAAVDAVLHALAKPAEIMSRVDDAARAERWQVITSDGEAQRWQVWRSDDRVAIRRGDEPVAMVLSTAAATAVRAVGPALRDRALLRLDPLRVAAIRATGVAPAALARGELIGEWLVDQPSGVAVALDAERLPLWLAQLRVETWAAPGALGAVRRTLTITSDPPPGAGVATVDTLRIGARTATGGCYVAVDRTAAALLPKSSCTRLLAPLTR